MSQIKAIETHYKGYRFRSRLEARWAVFFDAASIEWQYEAEGFKTEHDPPICYLPDFYLPLSKTWIEVKGSDEFIKREASKLTEILDWNSPLPGVSGSFGTNQGLLILGDIPYAERHGIFCHPLIQHKSGLVRSWATFVPGDGIQLISGGLLSELFQVGHDYGLECSDEDWTTKHVFIATLEAWNKVNDAYRAARSARFEHGESGALAR